MAEKIVYKNHCTPQEQGDYLTATDRWYLDSDVGRKMSGVCESKATTTGILETGTYSGSIDVTSSSNAKFIYVKNTDTSGSDYLLLNIGGMGALIKLMPGESFASDIGSTATDNTTVVITGSGTPTYEYIKGT